MPEEKEESEEYEGQLAIDVYQTDTDVVIQAPIAGVRPEDLEVSISDEMVTIKGERKVKTEITKDNFLCQECYWGSFSRSYVLPVAIDAAKGSASLKDGILTVTIPKLESSKTKILKVQTE